MDAYDAVRAWVYSGGYDLAPLTFRGKSDAELAAQLIEDWPCGWSKGECPHSLAELTAAFALVREEMR